MTVSNLYFLITLITAQKWRILVTMHVIKYSTAAMLTCKHRDATSHENAEDNKL